MKKVVYIVLTLVFITIITLNICSYFSVSFLGFRIFRIGSGSMDPYLKINDIIVIQEKKNYQINDVITFKTEDSYITHRIISIDNNVIITKGDANNIEDDEITKDVVIGKLVYKFKGVNFIRYLFSKPMSWVLLFILGTVFTILIPDK